MFIDESYLEVSSEDSILLNRVSPVYLSLFLGGDDEFCISVEIKVLLNGFHLSIAPPTIGLFIPLKVIFLFNICFNFFSQISQNGDVFQLQDSYPKKMPLRKM